MRSLLSWLMVFAVLAGLNVRSLAATSYHDGTCSHVEETCCDGHSHEKAEKEHRHDGEKCPSEHHHHSVGCCLHGSPLAVDNEHGCHVGVLSSRLLGVRHDGENAPDGPFLSSEKPPLI